MSLAVTTPVAESYVHERVPRPPPPALNFLKLPIVVTQDSPAPMFVPDALYPVTICFEVGWAFVQINATTGSLTHLLWEKLIDVVFTST